MICVRLQGGLGNQLFEIYAALSYALANHQSCGWFTHNACANRPVYFSTLFRALRPAVLSDADVLPATHVLCLREEHFHYSPLPPPPASPVLIRLCGYFQSPRYFSQHERAITKLLRLSAMRRSVCERCVLPLRTSVSLHVRWGDYKQVSQMHPVLPWVYYQRALSRLSAVVPDCTRVLCWCEEEDRAAIDSAVLVPLRMHFPTHVFEWVSNDAWEDWEQLLLMSACAHHVIANSTFSWWGAYLKELIEDHATNPSVHRVCYPSTWFGPAAAASHRVDDMFPVHWESIDSR